MTNKYSGKCSRCGLTVYSGEGNVEKKNGDWIVSHNGPCPDIESGLGVGGYGSEDYSIRTMEPSYKKQSTGGVNFGKRGTRYDEDCETCGHNGVVCNWCGNCKKHCTC